MRRSQSHIALSAAALPTGVDAVRAAKKVKGYTLRTVDAQQQPGSLIFPADATALA